MIWICAGILACVVFMLCALAYTADKVATMVALLRLLSDQLDEIKGELAASKEGKNS